MAEKNVRSVTKPLIQKFLLQNELKVGQLFKFSNAQNKDKNMCFFNKNLDLTIKLPFCKTTEKILNNLFNCDTQIEKINFLKNEHLLLYMNEAVLGNISDECFQGIRIQKAGLYYTILFYDTETQSGALLREKDNKIILVINFPKNGKVTWNIKGEFNRDNIGIDKCIKEYNIIKKNLLSSFKNKDILEHDA